MDGISDLVEEPRKKHHMKQDLKVEAEIMFEIVDMCFEQFNNGLLKDFDFLVGIYILCYLALRRPKAWCNGQLKEKIVANNKFSSMCIGQMHAKIQQIFDCDYIIKKIGTSSHAYAELSVMDIFNNLQLSGIKHNTDHYINRSIVMWAIGKRPIVLLFSIPTPMEVLRQQAAGERVVTMFVTLPELSTTHNARLAYMRGMQNHAKDPLEFLVHDLKHMEGFVDGETHLEQVGFFKSMLRLNKGRPRSYFLGQGTEDLGLDEELWQELEYVISDMNCFCTHLVRYLYAKLCSATRRKLAATHGIILQAEGSCFTQYSDGSSEEGTTQQLCADYELLATRNWALVLQRLGMAPSCEELGVAPEQCEYNWLVRSLCPTRVSATAHHSDSAQLPPTELFASELRERWAQVRRLSYHAAMALLQVSARKRKEWSEGEAEAVRLFFQGRGLNL